MHVGIFLREYDLPDVSRSAVWAEMMRTKPDVLRLAREGRRTPDRLAFLRSFRNFEKPTPLVATWTDGGQ